MWIPKYASAGVKSRKLFPKEAVFQEKGSGSVNRLVLTPVAELVLTFPFSEEWFTQLLKIVKQENLLPVSSLENSLVNDIAEGLVNDLDRSSQYDINLTGYRTEKINALARGNNKKKLREAIREIRDNRTALGNEFTNNIKNTQKNQSALIEDYFIASEFAQIEPELMKLLQGTKAKRRKVEDIKVESFDIKGKLTTSGSTPFRRITYKERGRDKVLSPRTLDRFLQSYGSLDKEIIGIEEAENKKYLKRTFQEIEKT